MLRGTVERDQVCLAECTGPWGGRACKRCFSAATYGWSHTAAAGAGVAVDVHTCMLTASLRTPAVSRLRARSESAWRRLSRTSRGNWRRRSGRRRAPSTSCGTRR